MALEELGGSDTQEMTRANPQSKSAADNLEGTRAGAAWRRHISDCHWRLWESNLYL